MSLEIKIPAVGESITSGLLSTWHKADGEMVLAGDLLLTLETDKVSSEIQAETAGTLRIRVPAGSDVKIGEVVGTIEEGAPPAQAASPSKEQPKSNAPAAEPKAAAGKRKDAPAAKPEPARKTEVAPAAPVTESGRLVSPKVPDVAQTGARGASSSLVQPESSATEGRSTRQRLSPLRRKIAQQLVMAQHTAAILTTFNEADMTAVMRLRSEMQESFTTEHGIKLGFMSFFIKAAVSALKAVPSVNGRMDGEDFLQHHYYDIGVAVGTERGLMVPVIRDADQKSFAQIERDLADFAGKAREGKIKIEDLQGGVFTISNGGIYGSLLSTPILNPPQSGILGMHKIQERPVAEKGELVIRPMMYLALSYDHRVVDGKGAVTFLVRVKECIEQPARLLLGL
jgi:2-oxoglutarate dehydrogenase E2 component (dihydrolipoamide succinyltransferase)